MTAEGETPQSDLSAGMFPLNKNAAPKNKKLTSKMNLSAGLVAKRKSAAAPADQPEGEKAPSAFSSVDSPPAAKRKKIAPKVNLLAGLVPKRKSATVPTDQPEGDKAPPTPSSTDIPPTARSTERGQPYAATVSASTEQFIRDYGAEKQVEPPATPKPETVAYESVSPVSPQMPATPPAQPSVRPRAPWVPRTGKVTRPEPTQPVRVHEPQPTAPPPALDESIHYPKTPPVESWERVSNRLDDFQPETAPETIREPEPEEAPYNAATRMSGLRNLIFSLGLKNLNKAAKSEDEEAEFVPQPGRGTERQVGARPFAPVPSPVNSSRSSASGASPTQVTATPEILPPEPTADKSDKERSWSSKSKGRRDRRDAYDDVEILPSWRGQYKKK